MVDSLWGFNNLTGNVTVVGVTNALATKAVCLACLASRIYGFPIHDVGTRAITSNSLQDGITWVSAITARKGVDLLQLSLTGTDSLQEGMCRSLAPMSKLQWLASRKSSPSMALTVRSPIITIVLTNSLSMILMVTLCDPDGVY